MKLSELEIIIDKYLSGLASGEEKQLVETWLNRPSDVPKALDPQKREELVNAIWGNVLGKINTPGKLIHMTNNNDGVVTRFSRFKRKYIVRIAASVLFIVMATVVYQYISGKRIQEIGFVSITANNGNALHYRLPDGSMAHLFPGSVLRIPENYNQTDRKILVNGRVFFEVQHNKSKPFYVEAGHLQTRVLGTSFELNALPEQHPTVVVKTGRVAVSWSGQQLTELTPNTRITIDPDNGAPVGKIDSVDASGLCNWWNGAFYFEQTPLPEVLRNISQWYKVSIHIQGSRWTKERVTMPIETNLSIQEVMQLLAETLGNQYKMTGQQIIIY